MNLTELLPLILVSIILSAFFSGMEIAYISANKLRIEIDRKQKKAFSGLVSFFNKNPGRYIATMLVGNNIALVIYGLAFALLLEEPIRSLLGRGAADALVLLIQTLISTVIILLTAEFLPKTLFRINPNNSLRLLSPLIMLFYILLYPVSILAMGISEFTMKHLLKVDPENEGEEPVFDKIDLDAFVAHPGHEQEVEDETGDLKIFKKALELSSLKVRDCMIPRTDVVALDETASIQELSERFHESGLSRILIFRNSIDQVVGYVNSKDLFHKPKRISGHIKPIQIVPETLSVNKLLTSFIKGGKSIAVVVDEFGGCSGVITTEDIIEEIFGEIEDEHDSSNLVEERLSNAHYRLSGRMEIDYLNEKYHLGIPVSDEYDTLAGYIINQLGDIPEKASSHEFDNYLITITDVSSNRIEEAELKVISPAR